MQTAAKTATPPDHSATASEAVICCTVYQEAVELVGRRWTGAIISVLLERPMRFCEISAAVPDLSDRLLAARIKELEERGLIVRTPCPSRQSSQLYSLTDMARELTPALDAIGAWARRWLAHPPN
ncbi:MAG: helix-turn-helix domain-containing protein [Actinomycetes bacterium]